MIFIALGHLPRLNEHSNVLDVATGTGFFPILLNKQFGAHAGNILATDFAPKMIELLNKKLTALSGKTAIKTAVMDAQVLLQQYFTS